MSEKNMNTFKCRSICQVGFVVKDVQASARQWAELLGVEMPEIIVTGPVEEANTKFHGESSPARAQIAFFHFGDVALELIEPIDGPSTWRDFLETKGEGVHHIAFHVGDKNDMNNHTKMFEEKGMPIEQQGDFTGGCYAYIDSKRKLGVILELLAAK
jgi:methylmalonyl-CoA/ethylmalonyl-CoA epimerase